MKLLLDTHSFIWFIEGNPALSRTARARIEDVSNVVLLSVASLWEMAIKTSTGKLTLSRQYTELIPEQITHNHITLLDITIDHTIALTTLPFHHRDPFDRMLIAQSLTENMPIISVDTIFDGYGVNRLW